MADETKLRELALAYIDAGAAALADRSEDNLAALGAARATYQAELYPLRVLALLDRLATAERAHAAVCDAIGNKQLVEFIAKHGEPVPLVAERDALRAERDRLAAELAHEEQRVVDMMGDVGRMQAKFDRLLGQRETLSKVVRSAVKAVAYASERDASLDEAYEELDGAVRKIMECERREAADAGR